MKKEQSHHSTTLLIAQAKYTNKRPYRKLETVKLLELLLFDVKRKKYLTIPVSYLAPVTFRDDSAKYYLNTHKNETATT